MHPIHCYSRRRLSPLRTTVQIAEAGTSRAVSYDGVNWQLSLLAETGPAWGSLNAGRGGTGFVTFAVWSKEEGVAFLPRSPLLSRAQLDEAAEPLLNFLVGAEPPFPADDSLELWALDGRGEPLALCATANDLWSAQELRPGPWRAQIDGQPPEVEAGVVERLVRATSSGQRQWFRRLPNGAGQPMPELGATVHAALLSAERFPTLPLRCNWPATEQRAAICAYLEARAILLLTLPTLSAEDRAWLEPIAWRQALEADRLHRLIPQVIDQKAFLAMRVEATLRRSL